MRHVLIPNHHIGTLWVGFRGQWIARIVADFFRKELRGLLVPELNTLGRRLIACMLDGGTVAGSEALAPGLPIISDDDSRSTMLLGFATAPGRESIGGTSRRRWRSCDCLGQNPR